MVRIPVRVPGAHHAENSPFYFGCWDEHFRSGRVCHATLPLCPPGYGPKCPRCFLNWKLKNGEGDIELIREGLETLDETENTEEHLSGNVVNFCEPDWPESPKHCDVIHKGSGVRAENFSVLPVVERSPEGEGEESVLAHDGGVSTALPTVPSDGVEKDSQATVTWEQSKTKEHETFLKLMAWEGERMRARRYINALDLDSQPNLISHKLVPFDVLELDIPPKKKRKLCVQERIKEDQDLTNCEFDQEEQSPTKA
jgi:hypothetical protein